jgi:rhodanese-related sulfurtransferase
MKAIRKTIFEVLVLGVTGVILGFSYNAVRATGSIKPGKNYFAKAVGKPKSPKPTPHVEPDPKAVDSTEPGRKIDPKQAQQEAEHPDHPYQGIKFAEVVDALNDPATEMGLNVFVDARNPQLYAEGHIPGALRCDPYESGASIDAVLEVALAADKVIVYCGGGECEDSIFMCRDLVDAGVEFDVIYLFAGGWTEWTDNGQPVEEGTH